MSGELLCGLDVREVSGKKQGKGSCRLCIRALRHESEWTGEYPFHVTAKFGFHLPPAALRMHPWPQRGFCGPAVLCVLQG